MWGRCALLSLKAVLQNIPFLDKINLFWERVLKDFQLYRDVPRKPVWPENGVSIQVMDP